MSASFTAFAKYVWLVATRTMYSRYVSFGRRVIASISAARLLPKCVRISSIVTSVSSTTSWRYATGTPP